MAPVNDNSIAIGINAVASGINSVAIGSGVTAAPNAIAIGDHNHSLVAVGGAGTVVAVDTLRAKHIECDDIRAPRPQEAIAVHHLPHPMTVRNGDEIVIKFTVTGSASSYFVKEAVLHGVPENRQSPAVNLARIVDSLAHFAKSLPKTKDDCDPADHVERAIRELAHAMLALDSSED